MSDRVQLVHRLPGDARLLQVVLDALHIAVSGRADRLFHMDFQDKMYPALEVEPELDVIGKRLLQRGRGHAMRDTQKAVAEHNQ